MLLMKIPSAPRGLSAPPTIVKPSDFLPGPFSNVMVWNVQFGLVRGFRGSVQNVEVCFIVLIGGVSGVLKSRVSFSLDSMRSQIFSLECVCSFNLSSSQRFEFEMAQEDDEGENFDLLGDFIVLNFISFLSILLRR